MSDERPIGPGTIMVHKSGGVVVISHRKDDDTGWWNTDRSGLSDAVAADRSLWTPYTARELRRTLDRASQPHEVFP